MDISSYEYIITNTKSLLTRNVAKELQKSTFSKQFAIVLEECENCVALSLDLVTGLLVEDSNAPQLYRYLKDVVDILRLLSSFIKTVIESVSMTCSAMTMFPTTTGTIIKIVFTHCKDSESIYGRHIKTVETQLKDLFRSCHELQLTYLIVMERHFIFDLTEFDELKVLVEALEINLKIGEVVQTLDVKTMAEQWKAYTMICEKYADVLKDKNVYQDAITVLCDMIEYNTTNATENNQDDKMILRSLKVASFTLKILLKVCSIFKNASNGSYTRILELLLYNFRLDPSYLETIGGKSTEFCGYVTANVGSASELLLKELLLNEHFVNTLIKLELSKLNTDKLLGYILMVIAAIKIILSNDYEKIKVVMTDCVIKWLPYGHIWFNVNLKIKTPLSKGPRTFGLYEYLLTHMYGLVSSFNEDESHYLEQKMLVCLLSTECYTALFCSNLWKLFARWRDDTFTFEQVQTLCDIYTTLDENKSLHRTPQEVHLKHTLSTIFEEGLGYSFQAKIWSKYNLEKGKDLNMWTVLNFRSCPSDIQKIAVKYVLDDFNMVSNKVFATGGQSREDIDKLIKSLQMVSNCEFEDSDIITDIIIKLWMRLCPVTKDQNVSFKNNSWYIRLIEALVSCTLSIKTDLKSEENLIKMSHIISNLISKGSTESKLILVNLICVIANMYLSYHNKTIRTSLGKTFTCLLKDSDNLVAHRTINEIKKRNSSFINDIVHENVKDFSTMLDLFDKSSNNFEDLLADLESTMDQNYIHKCVENNIDSNVCVISSGSTKESGLSRNFDLVDMDNLFEFESDSEPATKKAKLNKSDIEDILNRLESDANLLSTVKENVTSDHNSRINRICETLLNVIE